MCSGPSSPESSRSASIGADGGEGPCPWSCDCTCRSAARIRGSSTLAGSGDAEDTVVAQAIVGDPSAHADLELALQLADAPTKARNRCILHWFLNDKVHPDCLGINDVSSRTKTTSSRTKTTNSRLNSIRVGIKAVMSRFSSIRLGMKSFTAQLAIYNSRILSYYAFVFYAQIQT